jgi:hypothetical protein
MSLHPFKVGDSTFVVEISHHNDLPKVFERKVVRVSPKQLEIHGLGGRVIHRPTRAIGFDVSVDNLRWSPIVFATAEDALKAYAERCQTDLDCAKRRIERATMLRNHARALLHSLETGHKP